jgi:sortase A
MVRPAGRRVKRAWYARSAARIWSDFRMRPGSGARGEPYAWLNIPRSGIHLLVVNGTDEVTLSHFPGYASVGQASLVMAHRDTHFQRLGKVAEGDAIYLELRGGRIRNYRCRSIHIVDKADIEALVQRQSANDRLLLVTCYPLRYIGAAPRRLLVVADPA